MNLNLLARWRDWRIMRAERLLNQAVEDMAGIMTAGADRTEIEDGLAGNVLPILLPGSTRRELAAQGKLQEVVSEAYGMALRRSFAPYATATNFQFDNPYKRDAPVFPIYEDPLCEWEFHTRCYILEQCQAAYHRNPDAKAVDWIALFAMNGGFDLTTHHPDVESLLQEFIQHEENDLERHQHTLAKDLLLYGELIFRWYSMADGGEPGDRLPVPVIVNKAPWTLQGIKAVVGHRRRYEEFEFVTHDDDGYSSRRRYRHQHEWVPAADISYFAINAHSHEQRGRSELYSILPWLKARKDWLENRARIHYWLSAITYLVRVNSTSQRILANVLARWSRPPNPGSVAIEHKETEVDVLQSDPKAMDAADDGRQLTLQLAKGLHIPEYFMSDGENANLATATVQQLPALHRFQEHQDVMKLLLTTLFKKAVVYFVANGRLEATLDKHNAAGEPTGEMIKAEDAFVVEFKPVITPNWNDLTEALIKQVENQLVSRRTARGMLGHDPDLQEKEIQEEEAAAMEAEMDAIRKGLAPAPPQPNTDSMDGDGGDDDAGGDEDE